MSLLRLDKIICDSGKATRSEARRLITSGRVFVDGRAVSSPDSKFDPDTSEIMVSGSIICGKRTRCIMLHKPAGVLSATEDSRQETVLSLLPQELRRLGLFPVGRLDKDTTGLIILTNDGDFCHAVTSPRHKIEKRYEFTAEGKLTQADAEAFAEGLLLRYETKCLPAKLEIDPGDPSHGFVTVFEGKYHQVKRMLASRGAYVLTLKRLSIGGLELDPALEPGAFREMTETEREQIFNKNVTT